MNSSNGAVAKSSGLLTFGVSLAFGLLSALVGFAAGLAPALSIVMAVGVVGAIAGLLAFEYSIFGLLILRSGIDAFSRQQIPAVFAVGLDAIAIGYFVILLLQKKDIRINQFGLFFAGFCLVQSLWVVLVGLGGLGGVGSVSDSIREWVRLFSWCMLYWLIMQFRDRIEPQKLVQLLFWSLCIPLVVAVVQMIIPTSLPVDISPLVSSGGPPGESEGLRIRGTIGHPNAFATFIFFFIGLTYWKLTNSPKKLLWAGLLVTLAGFYVTAKALFSLGMLAVFLIFIGARSISPLRAVGLSVFFLLVLLVFGSSEFGQGRLESITNTPLLNPDIDLWRAIVLSKSDYNSFNWRLSQWTDLIGTWRHSPWLGYGLGLDRALVANDLPPHNDYIRWLVNGGIVGFTTMMAFWGAQYAHLISIMRRKTLVPEQKNLCYVMIAMLTSVLFGMITENIWDHTMLFFYWYVLMAVVSWDWNPPSQSSSTNVSL